MAHFSPSHFTRFPAGHFLAVQSVPATPPAPPSTINLPLIDIPEFFASIYYGSGTKAVADPPYFERDLLGFLKDTTGLSVFPGHIPQRAPLPALSFIVISTEHGHRMSGSAGFVESSIQITVASPSYIDCGVISERVRTTLQGYRGMMRQTQVYTALAGNQLSHYEPPATRSDQGIHTKISEYEIHYAESAPYPPPVTVDSLPDETQSHIGWGTSYMTPYATSYGGFARH